ncbi:MAG: alpha/beta fold hydrolase [Proteobacteria bacterium]|nr:alpha/beta fold hydrolase [Pseudomonadota bacterium]
MLEFPTSDGSGDSLTGTLENPFRPEASPLILLIHGLAGSEDSTYVRESARFHLVRGRAVLRLNLRGAGTSRCLSRGYYHAGAGSDVEDVLNSISPEQIPYGIFAIGFSLGGNILLNLLGRISPRQRLIGAAVVSAPIKPIEACQRIMARRNYLYQKFLLRRIKRDVLSSKALSARERQSIEGARSIYEFDDGWVAPRNGFHGARDYYERTAGSRYVNDIRIPTLMLHACNDPWIPVAPYLELQHRHFSCVEILIASGGGHVGFHERGFADTWHDRKIDDFLRKLIAGELN